LPLLSCAPLPPQDKTNGYDFFYRQDVIKPALVGLAGPWISGGVEFNWCGDAHIKQRSCGLWPPELLTNCTGVPRGSRLGITAPCRPAPPLCRPQHHRPSTFMPCDVHIERDEASGAVTVWCSEHEPMNRMKVRQRSACMHPTSVAGRLKSRQWPFTGPPKPPACGEGVQPWGSGIGRLRLLCGCLGS
jgi:hypothetical protein